MKAFQRFISIVITTFFWLAVAGAVAVLFFSMSDKITGSIPFRTYVVQSGSMEPAIGVGDLLIITPQEEYLERDVITFKDYQERVVTHRILEVSKVGNGMSGQYNYVTKGDANQNPDAVLVNQANVIGKVIQVIPKLGLLITFSRSTTGIITLLVIPTGLIIFDEVLQIVKVVKNKKSKK